MGVTAHGLAKDLKIPANRITGIVNEERAITADTAVLLGHYFGTSAEMWMNLQSRFDLRNSQRAAEATLSKLPRHAA
jgi:antitoxin HigA-1